MPASRHFHKRADRWLFAVFLLLMLWAPLPVASNHLWAWSILEVGIFGLTIAWLALFWLERVALTPAFRRAWPALLLFAAIFFWMLVQLAPLPVALLEILSPEAVRIAADTQTVAVISLDPAGTRDAALKTLAYGLMFALTLLIVNRRGRLRVLALTIVFSGVFQAAFGALMMLSGLEYGFFIEKLHGRGDVTGTFVNANHLAGYLEMCIALGVGVMLGQLSATPAGHWRERVRRLMTTLLGDKARVRIALVIMVIGIVLSKSRMGNVAFLSSLIIAGSFYVLVVRRLSVAVLAFFVSIFLIDVVVIGNYFGLEKVAVEIQKTTQLSDAARLHVARDALGMIRDFPFTGTGAGSFASTFPMYDSGEVGAWHYQHAHNDYLQFTIELGVTGVAMVAAILLLSLWQAVSAQIKRRDHVMRGLACGVLMAIIALLIHSSVDFNLQIPANALTFVVILALAWNTRWLRHRASLRAA